MLRCMNGFRYPYTEDVRNGRYTEVFIDEEPDMIGMAPNYDRFKGWSIEEVLVWLNID